MPAISSPYFTMGKRHVFSSLTEFQWDSLLTALTNRRFWHSPGMPSCFSLPRESPRVDEDRPCLMTSASSFCSRTPPPIRHPKSARPYFGQRMIPQIIRGRVLFFVHVVENIVTT